MGESGVELTAAELDDVMADVDKDAGGDVRARGARRCGNCLHWLVLR
jgi:hypothetical protein